MLELYFNIINNSTKTYVCILKMNTSQVLVIQHLSMFDLS